MIVGSRRAALLMDADGSEAALTAAERRHGDRRNLVFEDKSAQWIVGSKTRHLPIPREGRFCVLVCVRLLLWALQLL